MTSNDKDDLWRDFPKTATEFEARFATEEDCRAYWIEARWGGEPACARCAWTRVWTDPRWHHFECARLRPPDEPDVGHAPGEDAQAPQDVVPRDVRDLDAAHRHLGQGSAAHHGVRLLQDGVDLAAQAAGRRWCAPDGSRSALVWGLLIVKAGSPRRAIFLSSSVSLLDRKRSCSLSHADAHNLLRVISLVRPRRRLSLAPTAGC